ncbi:unnamed protein product [Amoebophrya sp. A25]|nr:unnamed protein product [Amoebophrya sp. A25]|eukprot:GSA25T00026794001.1
MKFDGESFATWDELKDYCEEFGHTAEQTTMSLVEEYGAKITRMVRDINNVRNTKTDGDAEEWEVKIGTCHSVKGMEFDAPVLLSDDFPLPVDETTGQINEDQLAGSNETLNLLYVGVTRAKGAIRCRDKIWGFFTQIGVTEETREEEPHTAHEQEPEADARHTSRVMEYEDFDRAWQMLEELWQAEESNRETNGDYYFRDFVQRSEHCGRMYLFPVPEVLANPASLHAGRSREDGRERFKKLRLWYHTDKHTPLLRALRAHGYERLSQRASNELNAIFSQVASAQHNWKKDLQRSDRDPAAP